MRKYILFLFILFCFSQYSLAQTPKEQGKEIYESRCAMCHGSDARASGPLAQKSNPPTPDLTSCAFQERLAKYPGVIVSSIVLRPNGNLIPKTLKDNGVHLPPKKWTEDDLRAINEYLVSLIAENTSCKF